MVCCLNLIFSGKIQHLLTTPHTRILACKRRYRGQITKFRTIIMNKNTEKGRRRTSQKIQTKPCLIAKIKLRRTKQRTKILMDKSILSGKPSASSKRIKLSKRQNLTRYRDNLWLNQVLVKLPLHHNQTIHKSLRSLRRIQKERRNKKHQHLLL